MGDGRALLRAAEVLKPDLVLVDVGMPLLNGSDAARRLKKSMPKLKIIFLTMNPDSDVASEALDQRVWLFAEEPARRRAREGGSRRRKGNVLRDARNPASNGRTLCRGPEIREQAETPDAATSGDLADAGGRPLE